jgi:hypothetical protein
VHVAILLNFDDIVLSQQSTLRHYFKALLRLALLQVLSLLTVHLRQEGPQLFVLRWHIPRVRLWAVEQLWRVGHGGTSSL